MMKLGRAFGIPLRIHPAALPMAALAIWLGEGRRLAVMSGSILLHELAHIAAARVMHVRVIELELMPMGGAARLENLWRLRPGQMASVALAGPVCNLLLMVGAAALCWWEILPPDQAAMLIEQNAVIFLFNMLPALPMDGGRILCGLLCRRLSPAGAARIGAWTGYGLAAALIGLSVYGLIHGRMNITMPAAALFLLMSAERERRQSECSALESLTGRAAELEEERILPVRWMAARRDTSVREAAGRLRPRFMHIVAVYDERLKLTDVLSEEILLDALMKNEDAMLGELHENVKTKIF